jgi:hypothetical protein
MGDSFGWKVAWYRSSSADTRPRISARDVSGLLPVIMRLNDPTKKYIWQQHNASQTPSRLDRNRHAYVTRVGKQGCGVGYYK